MLDLLHDENDLLGEDYSDILHPNFLLEQSSISEFSRYLFDNELDQNKQEKSGKSQVEEAFEENQRFHNLTTPSDENINTGNRGK